MGRLAGGGGGLQRQRPALGQLLQQDGEVLPAGRQHHHRIHQALLHQERRPRIGELGQADRRRPHLRRGFEGVGAADQELCGGGVLDRGQAGGVEVAGDRLTGEARRQGQHRVPLHLRPGGRVLGRLQRRGEGEHRALADRAGDLEAAPHGVDQPLGDRQAQARAAEPAGGGLVGLGEGLEQGGDLVGGDADAGVADAELQPAAGRRRDLDHHPAGLGELDGVVDEV